MKKVISVITLIATLLCPLSASAQGFDAAYYANRYPDVVNELGTSPEALYNHYMTFGINEGRFQNAEEESTGIKESVQPQIQQVAGYNTYVDVDLLNQTVTYFEGGQVKLQTPCVTGNVSAGHSTPKGVYTIKTHTAGKYLIGPTWKCWVDYWMRFTDDSIGLHDATWRSNFGGDIYRTDGSHGCVNLPHDAAAQLFDMVSTGTTVIVH